MANIKKIQLGNEIYDIVDATALHSENIPAIKQEIVAEIVGTAPDTLDTLGEIAEVLNDNENTVEAILEEIGTKANKTDVAQSDWEVNKSNEAAYIKNRTHYKEETLVDFIIDYPVEDMTLEFQDGYAHFEGYEFIANFPKLLVVWDEVEYKVYADENQEYGDGITTPFVFSFFPGGMDLKAYNEGVLETGTTSHIISLWAVLEKYKKLDLNYLPDGVSVTPISYEYQELTKEQQKQTRENIGAISIEQLEENKITLTPGKNIDISFEDNSYLIDHEAISTETYVSEAVKLDNGGSFIFKEVETDNGHVITIKETEIKLPHIETKEQVQADWAQSSTSEKSYIKNRTHYKEEKLEDWTVTPSFKDTVITFVDGEKFWTFQEYELYSTLLDGAKVQVIWDGTPYNLTAYEAGTGVHVGGENFPFQIGNADSAIYIYSFNNGIKETGETSHTVTVQLIKDNYKKLDLEYLPNEVIISDYQQLSEAQKAQVKENLDIKNQVQADWNSNSLTSDNFIKNRTHYINDSGEYIPLDEKFIPESIRNKQDKINSGYTLPSYAEVGTFFLLLEE